MYSKYHGCGNDFIIGRYNSEIDYSQFAKKVCNRHTGIGSDGLMLAKCDEEIEMIFYNADGSRAPMCGNGIRCFAKYLIDEGLVHDSNFNIKTLSGTMKIKVKQAEDFCAVVNLGKAIFDSKVLDIDTPKDTFLDEEITYLDEGELKKIKVDAVYMATHHLVVLVDDLDKVQKTNLGEILCNHPLFKKGINVNFVQVIDKSNVRMKTYERGVGWTLACGTGASASFVILNRKSLCDERLNIILEEGSLLISYNDNFDVLMEGTSQRIASGIIFY